MIIFKVMDGILQPALIHNNTVAIFFSLNLATSYLSKFSRCTDVAFWITGRLINISLNGNFVRGCMVEIFKCLGEVEAVKPGESYSTTSSK